MKKVLLSLFLMGAVLFGRAQVVLNEIFTEPKAGQSEFIELYNTGIDPLGENLNCYNLVILFKSNNNIGAYVLDFPDVTIGPKSWLVATSSTTIATGTTNVIFNTQTKTGKVASFSWNLLNGTPPSGQPTGGSLKEYSTTSSVGSPVTSNNLFSAVTGQFYGGPILGAFLFKNDTYVNGFIGGHGSTSVPPTIYQLPAISGLSNPCKASFSIDFNLIRFSEYSGENLGQSNGYTRKGDGLCGNWVKSASNETPGETNGTTTTTGSILTTSQQIYCGSYIEFSVTGPTNNTSGAFPIEVRLYEDKGSINALDPLDIYIQSYPSLISSASSTPYNFSGLDPNKKYLLVYRTQLGCYDVIKAPDVIVAGALTTKERLACNKVYARVEGLTGGAIGKISSVTINLYGKSSDGTLSGILDSKTQTTVPSTTYQEFDVSAYNYPSFQVEYIVPNYGCFNKPLTAVIADATSLTTTQQISCGQNVQYTIPSYTADLNLQPLKVYAFYDNSSAGTQGIYDPGTDELVTGFPFQPTSFPYTSPIFAVDGNKKVMFYYETGLACKNSTASPSVVTGPTTLETTQESFCGDATNPTRIQYRVISASGSNAEFGFPIKIDLYYDLNKDGNLQDNEREIKQTASISSFMTDPANPGTFLLPLNDRTQEVILIYTAVNNCFTATEQVQSGCTITPVKFSSFTAARNKQNTQQVDLTWTTAMEQNNKGFHVQRKTEGEWKDVGFVFSAAEGGNSTQALTYRFKEVNTFYGVSQYRLLQVDLDGKATYSDVKALMGEGQKAGVLVFPNPAVDGKVNLVFSDATARTIVVSDMSGRIVKQYRSITSGSLTVDGLKAGFYTIKITDVKGASSVQKIIVQ